MLSHVAGIPGEVPPSSPPRDTFLILNIYKSGLLPVFVTRCEKPSGFTKHQSLGILLTLRPCVRVSIAFSLPFHSNLNEVVVAHE